MQVNFKVVLVRATLRVSEFTVPHLGIPLHICETKEGYRRGEAAQTRFNGSTRTHTHTHNHHNRTPWMCVRETEIPPCA